MIRIIRIAAFAWAMLLMCASLATACSFIEPPHYLNTILARKENNSVTVHGILVKMDTTNIGIACGNQPISDLRLYFQVKKAFGSTADAGDTVVFATPISSATCGVSYPLGSEVVVFGESEGADCQKPAGMLWTTLSSFNVHQPTQSQLDSLYGHTAPITKRAHSHKGAQVQGAIGIGRNGNSRIGFGIPGGAATWFGADGRSVVFPR